MAQNLRFARRMIVDESVLAYGISLYLRCTLLQEEKLYATTISFNLNLYYHDKLQTSR
jgi:hypothetical protein